LAGAGLTTGLVAGLAIGTISAGVYTATQGKKEK